MILVDTSVWIPYLDHGRGELSDRVDALLDVGEILALTPVILQEVLQGARSEQHPKRLRNALSTQVMLQSTDWIETCASAAAIFARCRWVGITPRSSNDCLIAQIAIEHGVPLFHNDRDFDAIHRVAPSLALI